MPAIDEYRFLTKSLLERIIRIEKVADEVEKAPTTKNKALLKVMSEKVDDYHAQYLSTVQKIVAYNFKNGIEEDLTEEVVKFEDPYFMIKAVLEATYPSDSRPSLGDALLHTGGSSGSALNVQLPKIKLPEFHGEVRSWQAFSELFRATVDANSQLSDVQKHMYLRSALSGEALALVVYLPLTGPNYSVCWDTLKRQYDNIHLQTTAHLESLYSLPTTSQNPSSIRTFASQITEATGALGALGYDVEGWAVPLLFLCCRKLHVRLREDWERHLLTAPDPSLRQFTWFLQEQARVLEASRPAGGGDPETGKKYSSRPPHKATMTMLVDSKPLDKCSWCDNSHLLDQCGSFRQAGVQERLAFVRAHRLCMSCLLQGHFVSECPKQSSCKHCSYRHHSLLHFQRPEDGRETGAVHSSLSSPAFPGKDQEGGVSSHQVYASSQGGQVLLATAVAQVLDHLGEYQRVRVLIDPASQATFITAACVKRLGLSSTSAEVPVLGMGHVSLGVCKQQVQCNFKPEHDVELQVNALVVENITCAPQEPVSPLPVVMTKKFPLADPGFHQPATVDVLLGAEWFGCVILDKPVLNQPGLPSLLKSIWGYCLVGRHRRVAAAVQTLCMTAAEDPPTTEALLKRFWELEEPPKVSVASPEDQACEEIYSATVSRLSSGRYVVTLPFRTESRPLGDSRRSALRRFLMMEKRLQRNSILGELYCTFMKDYLEQGHMRLAPPIIGPEKAYYIPHHCIFRQHPGGEISKFRVVFDSSMPTKNGPSLNQVLLRGPKLQAEILDILLRFRFFEVVLTTDIRQMYRNIALREDHHNYQRILWRSSLEDPISEYCLTTVTYGVSSSPFLAIRTLHQLVTDEGKCFPAASDALLQDTYMDDVIKSVPSVEAALQLKDELVTLLGKAGFELRKWLSNREEILASLPPEHCAVPVDRLAFNEENELSTKILGLVWMPKLDTFSYTISQAPNGVTKRLIMSDIAKLFDPVGFISPVIFFGKCLIRKLWQLGIGWDDPAPDDVCNSWRRYRSELKELEDFSLPRWIQLDQAVSLELHGFADSSELGFAGVVYLRCKLPSEEVRVFLMMAKSKVAPISGQTLPRLELCAIELVTRLLEYVSGVIHSTAQPSLTVWSDSTVALHWVKSSPHRWKTFVANRVSACQRRVPVDCYRHVPTACNPADCASRGLYPGALVNHNLWKAGPQWLLLPPENWPYLPIGEHLEESEAKLVCHLNMNQAGKRELSGEIFGHFSSLMKLYRAVAWYLRFWNNSVLHPLKNKPLLKGPLQIQEIREAGAACCRWVQRMAFPNDVKALSEGRHSSRPLRRLNPFLDNHGIIRVGGRLRHSALPYSQKYPVILPKDHPFTSLIIDHYHKSYLHPGLSNLHSILRRHFWILAARSAISTQLSRCMNCFRAHPRTIQPMMGDLPANRLIPGKAFEVTGVDYGGPFQIKMNRVRKAAVLKAYICLFVCFTTKAVHLELASNLSTEAFMAALKRFIARRGSVSVIHSDCGTNFVGAKNKMEGWKELVQTEQFNNSISGHLASRGIEWKLNPPASPHFGGLWESGIKSTKNLLARTIGEQILTFEEFYTVLVQVEATLNSRPLIPLSSDPEDLQALTPGHFLMMEAPSALFEEPPPPSSINPRDRWTLLRQLVASFWKRWSLDYLNTLQLRNEWNRNVPNLQEGILVLIKDPNLPPLRWQLARIVTLYPGPDGIARVADVRTPTGIYRRAVVHLCPLPEA